ncbi:MAG: hypothetical protein HYX42_02080 [Polaromonas sp.]|uniref:hypothetical protein n=1 Tax=Polaromonas sp. TaxID=1869339 RepID=UPI0025D94B4F|nr:hypothetical protein [Polaromonas sp.]MBI2725016.1 hypothetical protein [Polaromonas sp.]
MTPLQLPTSTPLDTHSSIAIGIAGSNVTGDKKQKHVAFIHQNPLPNPWLLHLAWHRRLFHHPWDGQYYWIGLSRIDSEVQEEFSDWARIVAGRSKDLEIPYSVFFVPDGNFDVDGQFIDRGDGSGLTCATFILAMFADYGLPLLRIDSWPKSRPGDFSWMRKILKALRPVLTRSEFLSQIARRHELKRFRPEEVVAAASIFEGVPLEFDEVVPVSKVVLTQVPR